MTWLWLDDPPTEEGIYDYAGRGGFGELVAWRTTAGAGLELRFAVLGPGGLVADGSCSDWDACWGDAGLEGQARGVRWHEPRQRLPPPPDVASEPSRWRSHPVEPAGRMYSVALEADGVEVGRATRGGAATGDMRLTILADVARVWAHSGRSIDGDELVVRIRRES